MSWLQRITACVFLLAAVAPTGFGATPETMHIQGRLTNSDGSPITVAATLAFRIHAGLTTTLDLWPQQGLDGEQHVVTPDENGLWNVVIGTTYPIPPEVFSEPDRWLQIIYVDSNTFFPRIKLASTPYSSRVGTLDGASGGDVFGDIHLHSDLIVGSDSGAGYLVLQDDNGFDRIRMYGQTGLLETRVSNSFSTLIGGSSPDNQGGYLQVSMGGTSIAGVIVDGWDGNSGNIVLQKADIASYVPTMVLDADGGDGGAQISLEDGSQESIRLDGLGADGVGGEIALYNTAGVQTMKLDADAGGSGLLRLFDNSGTWTAELDAREGTTGGQLRLRNDAGVATIELDAEQGDGGDGRITTQTLLITGGSDLSERFNVRSPATAPAPQPGMVVCLDPESPGELLVSTSAYDRTVAGIISGAGGVKTGLLMGQKGSEADGLYSIALTGRVYVMASAENGPVRVGDLLTTSDIPGHAESVADHARAQGAIIGKAMSPLEAGRGLVLALVTLQ